MNRKHLQSLSRERLKDAKALLGRKRWAAAYYLAGYAVECGLKACVLRFVEDSGLIFRDKDGMKRLADCWTHDLAKLVGIADLKQPLDAQTQLDEQFDVNWKLVKDWSEVSRYELTDEPKARALFQAITDNQHGVFQWIQKHW